MTREILIKLVLSILLLLCLFRMPYAYYQLVRVISMIGFSILAYRQYSVRNIEIMILYIGLAVVFQPFVKVYLGREIWNVLDVLVAVFLIVSILIKLFYSKK